MHERAELERPDAAHRRDARLRDTGPERHEGAVPHISKGHQVILSGLGHVDDFFSYEPSASTQLLTTFYATGQVDTSRYTPNVVSFTTSQSQAAIAKKPLRQWLASPCWQ